MFLGGAKLPIFQKVGSLVPPRNVSVITRPGIKAESAETMAMMTVQTTLTTIWMMLQRFHDGL